MREARACDAGAARCGARASASVTRPDTPCWGQRGCARRTRARRARRGARRGCRAAPRPARGRSTCPRRARWSTRRPARRSRVGAASGTCAASTARWAVRGRGDARARAPRRRARLHVLVVSHGRARAAERGAAEFAAALEAGVRPSRAAPPPPSGAMLLEAGQRVCPECTVINDEGGDACAVCGASLDGSGSAKAPPAVPRGGGACGSCGAPNPGGAAVCGTCGLRMVARSAPRRRPMPPGMPAGLLPPERMALFGLGGAPGAAPFGEFGAPPGARPPVASHSRRRPRDVDRHGRRRRRHSGSLGEDAGRGSDEDF